jgi:hypothetical protein
MPVLSALLVQLVLPALHVMPVLSPLLVLLVLLALGVTDLYGLYSACILNVKPTLKRHL